MRTSSGIQVSGVEGLVALASRSEGLKKVIMGSLAGGLFVEGEQIMARSKDEFVPVDTGALKSTGHVEKPVVLGTEVSVELGYGGPTGVATADGKDYVGYALYVHEGTSHMEGRFFLERPAMEEAPALPERIKGPMSIAIVEYLAHDEERL